MGVLSYKVGRVYDLVIRGGAVVASDNAPLPFDIGIRNGKVAALARETELAAERTLSAEGLVVLPGVIDLHTHLRSVAGDLDLFAGETASAVAGGITTLGDFSYPAGTRFELEYERKRDRLESQSLCDFLLHTVVRSFDQLEQAGTRTVKVFLSASGLGAKSGIGLELVKGAMAKGHQVLVHVEDLDDYLEIARLILASSGKGRAHILHVPHQRYSRIMHSLVNQRLTLETCPQYLLWEWTRGRQGCDVNPSVVAADLWSEIQQGRIDTIGTDHCSYSRQDKEEYGLPGFPGLETLLRIMFTCGVKAGRISWADLCRVLSAGPARVLDLYPQKGTIQIGSDADLVLFDPGHQDPIGLPCHGRGDFSPFQGLHAEGKVVGTLVRGRQVYVDGTVDLDARGWGTWVEPGRKIG